MPEHGATRHMAEDSTLSRRTALRTLGTVAALTATASTATGGSTAQSAEDTPPATGGELEGEVSGDLTGLYSGTVDRIVDGEHLVILIEDGGSVVGQHVAPAEEYPSLDEGDPVVLFLLFGTVIAIWPGTGA